MKVFVISGFLGAGKTTFIKTMVQRTGKSFCILENEYAGSRVDTTILEGENDLQVWEMTEGCICCTMKNSFANKIMNILGLLQPDYLIVEATGIGFLSRIISNIRTVEHDRITLMQPITVVDADSVLQRSFLENDLYLDQVKNARVLILSKCETRSEEELVQAGTILRRINPAAEIVCHHYSFKSDGWWQTLLTRAYDGHVIVDPAAEETNWDSITLNNVTVSGLSSLIVLLQDLLNGRYGKVIRAKGYLKTDGHWFLCDISGERYSISTAKEQKKSNFICIGDSLAKDEIKRRFIKTSSGITIRPINRPYGPRPNSITLQG